MKLESIYQYYLNEFKKSGKKPYPDRLLALIILPEKDKYSQSMTYLKSRLSILFAGRLAEEMIFGREKVSTGASNDIQVATTIARKMVSEWGMSDVMGPIAYDEPEGEVFLGYSISKRKNVSDLTAQQVDAEIRKIIDAAYQKTREILTTYKQELDTLALGLIEYETLSGDEISDLLQGKEIRVPVEKAKIKSRATVPSVGDVSESIDENIDITTLFEVPLNKKKPTKQQSSKKAKK